jgi:hypothetical protein
MKDQNSQSAVSVDCTQSVLSSLNFTTIVLTNCQSVLCSAGDSVDCEGIYFANCESNSVIFIEEESEALTKINFVNSQGRTALVFTSDFSIEFRDCAFVNDNSLRLVNKYAILRNCVFSNEFDSNLFPSSCFTASCSFRAGWQTKNFDIYGSQGCWILMSPSSNPAPPSEQPQTVATPENSGSSTIFMFLVVLAVVGVIGVALYLIWKWWNVRDDGARLLRMYSQV